MSSATTPTASTLAMWTTAELAEAQRKQTLIETTFKGMRGTIEQVRDDGVVVLNLGFGKGYFQTDALKSLPSRYDPGARVKTPYGPGVVVAYRGASVTRVDYAVDIYLGDKTGSAEAVTMRGYLDPAACSLRTFLTYREALADANKLREEGNAAFARKEYEEAVSAYAQSLDAVAHYRGPPLNITQRAALREVGVKAISNTAQVFLSQPQPDYDAVIAHASEGLNIDPRNETGQRDKLLYRRGCALAAKREWELAGKDLSDPVLAGNPNATRKLAEVREALRKESEHARKVWSTAFSKAAAETTAEGASSATASSSAASAPAPAPAASTPHPAKRHESRGLDSAGTASSMTAVATADEEEGDEEAGTVEEEEEGSTWKTVLTYGAAALGVAALGAGAAYLLSKSRGARLFK